MNMLYRFLCILLLIPFTLCAQTTGPDLSRFIDPTVQLPNTVDCFEYYSFGSVQVNITPSVLKTVPGATITFSGMIQNKNNYPVVNGSLIVKIFKINDNGEKNIYGPDVIDEFVPARDVVIGAASSSPVSFTWNVPSFLDGGIYKAVTFFTVADKFNLLGLSFTDDIVGNSAEFEVKGFGESIRFDKKTVTINDEPYYFAAYPPQVSKDSDVKIVAELSNTTSQTRVIPVTWKVYSWDGQRGENLIKEYTEKVTVKSGSVAKVEYLVSDNSNPVYYVKLEAVDRDVSSILNIRFVRQELNRIRINFPSITKYPLVKGESNTVFSCLHSVSNTAETPVGLLKLKLKDSKGNNIHEYEYKGPVSGMMMGVKDSFIPDKNYSDFTLEANLFEGDKLVDSANLNYTCKTLNPDLCTNNNRILFIIIGIIILCSVILYLYKKKRNVTGSVNMFMLMCILTTSFLFISGIKVSAADVQWNQTVNKGFMYDAAQGGWGLGLVSPNITVRYSAQVTNADTGELLSSNSTITQGTKLNFTFSPHSSSDIYWFGTGYSQDSPYGEWRTNADAPAVSCSTKDFLNYDGVAPYRYGVYIPLVIAPPTKSLTNTSGMTCVDVNSTTKQCTVTGTGTLNPTFQFNSTIGKFYYRYKQDSYGQIVGAGCVGNNVPMEVVVSSNSHVPYTLDVSAQTIPYVFNVATLNNAPQNPTITGPTVGYTDQSYTFTFKTTDSDNDQVRYGIDLSNSGTVNQWLPGSGYVPDETDQVFNKTWTTPGTYTFRVKAQDINGSDSGWVSHTITIVTDKCTNISGGQSASLFSAHNRDYFQSLDDGKLYFVPSSASSPQVCAVDMCADTSAIEEDMPAGYVWNPSGVTAYQQYSCVLDTPEVCSCSGRTYNCSDNGVQTSSTSNSPQCALTASCSYAQPTGNQVTFNYTATNVLGSLINGGSQAFTIPTTGQGTISDSRVLSNTGDGQTSTAACSYNYVSTIPEIISFVASKVVAQGSQCSFTWQTADMTSCTLGGESVGLTGSRFYSTSAGKNISKTLSCTTNEQVPQTVAMTRTCFVKPEVEER